MISSRGSARTLCVSDYHWLVMAEADVFDKEEEGTSIESVNGGAGLSLAEVAAPRVSTCLRRAAVYEVIGGDRADVDLTSLVYGRRAEPRDASAIWRGLHRGNCCLCPLTSRICRWHWDHRQQC